MAGQAGERVKLEEIGLARQMVLDNARSLVEEAELLFEHDKYPRAYCLAHLACEEMMKLPLLLSAGCDLELGRVVKRTSLDKLLKSHRRKLQALALFDGWFCGTDPDGLDTRQVAEDLSNTEVLNDFKNLSLYVTMTTDGFISPERAVDEAGAKVLVSLSRSRLRMVELLEAGQCGRLEAYVASPFHTSVAQELIDRLSE